MFALPNFNQNMQSQFCDFSSIAACPPETEEIRGLPIDLINKYMSNSWWKAYDLASAQTAQLISPPAIYLAECRSTASSSHNRDTQFYLKFNAPQVAALCDDEVIVYFNVDEVLFYHAWDLEMQ